MKKNRKKITVLLLTPLIITTISGILPINRVLASNSTLPSGLTVEQLNEESNTYLSEKNLNNAAVAFSVVNEDCTLYESITGYINKEENLTADADTIFEWGSMTKMLTWIGLMQLHEQGKLDFDEDISTYIPADFFKKRSYSEKITVLELMNHSAGWQDSITNVYTNDASGILPLKEYLIKNEPPQLFAPGEVVAYSNWGTALGGYLIEVISGEEYCDYIQNHILAPLGMKNTSIDPLRRDNALVKRGLEKITGYSTDGKQISGRYYAPDYPAAAAAGTLGDVKLFAQALLAKENTPLFEKQETLETMVTATRMFADTEVAENAHGFWFDFYETPSLGHCGNTVQFSTHLSFSPEEGIAMIVMTNQSQEMALTQGLGNFVFGERKDTATKQNFTPLRFHKNYCASRTIQKGYCSFYNFFQTYHIKQLSDIKYQISSLTTKLNCNRVSENCLVVSDGLLEGYRFYFELGDENMVEKIATTTFELVPFSDSHALRDIISYIALTVALLFILISICTSIHQLRKRKPEKKNHIFALTASALSIFYISCIPMEAAKLMTTAASTKDMIPIVLYYVFYLFFSLCTVIFYLRAQKKSLSLTLSVIACLLLSGFTLYWQMIFI